MRQEIKDLIVELGSRHQEFTGLHNLLINKDIRQIKKTVMEIIGDISMDQQVREMDDYPDKFMVLCDLQFTL
ncbi:MAG: hypothetical protein MI921_27010 [Cytophagales bacterium]|nr:hypothetical protein [Cytophagales bacterium]